MNHHQSSDRKHPFPSSQSVAQRRGKGIESDPHNAYLQQALGCLDVKLEDELTRFRSQKIDRLADLPSILATTATWEKEPIENETDSEILTAEIVQSAISRPSADEINLDPPEPSGFIIINGLPTPKSSSNTITTVNYGSTSNQSGELTDSLEHLNLNFSTGGEIASFHDEYLASSQELLRQIQSGYTKPTNSVGSGTESSPAPAKRQIPTPVKLGSIAAACILAGGAAYTYFHPTILTALVANQVAVPSTNTANVLGQAIHSPNLAANEFTELNLSTINTIKLPPAATNTNVSTTNIQNPPTTTPTAIPFNGINAPAIPPTTITAQPRLADSLVKSLLPSNFHPVNTPARPPVNQARIGR
jgi:hypothetical protein